MQVVAQDLAVAGFVWQVRPVAADGPVFGTPGMPRVELVSETGEVGAEVWLESDTTLRLGWRGGATEWFGSDKSDLILADVIYALCSGKYALCSRGILRVSGRAGRRAHRLHLG
jgi:hypothetical protein